jgi:hypothetical protein
MLGAHHRHHRPDAGARRQHVETKHCFDVGGAGIGYRCVEADPGVVYKDVDRSEIADGRLDQALDLRIFRDIRGDGLRSTAFAADGRGYFVECCRVPGGESDLSALPTELDGNRPPDSL